MSSNDFLKVTYKNLQNMLLNEYKRKLKTKGEDVSQVSFKIDTNGLEEVFKQFQETLPKGNMLLGDDKIHLHKDYIESFTHYLSEIFYEPEDLIQKIEKTEEITSESTKNKLILDLEKIYQK